MSELDRMAAEFGTDKSSIRTGPLAPKGYTLQYERYLAPWRERPMVLLEIGVARGASLRMWEAYLPAATIVGIDVDERCRAYETARTRVFIGSQTDRGFLRDVVDSVGGVIDVVIDDGGHRMDQHRVSLEELFPRLGPGGLYAIEDLHTAYWPAYGGGYRAGGSTIEYLKGLVDSLNHGAATAPSARGWMARLRERAFGARPAPGPGALPRALERLAGVHFYPSLAVLLRDGSPASHPPGTRGNP